MAAGHDDLDLLSCVARENYGRCFLMSSMVSKRLLTGPELVVVAAQPVPTSCPGLFVVTHHTQHTATLLDSHSPVRKFPKCSKRSADVRMNKQPRSPLFTLSTHNVTEYGTRRSPRYPMSFALLRDIQSVLPSAPYSPARDYNI